MANNTVESYDQGDKVTELEVADQYRYIIAEIISRITTANL